MTKRARKLRAQYALQAQSLRTRIERRVHRIPASLLKANIGVLLLKYIEEQDLQKKGREPPAALKVSSKTTAVNKGPVVEVIKAPNPSAPNQLARTRGVKRTRYWTLECTPDYYHANYVSVQRRSRQGKRCPNFTIPISYNHDSQEACKAKPSYCYHDCPIPKIFQLAHFTRFPFERWPKDLDHSIPSSVASQTCRLAHKTQNLIPRKVRCPGSHFITSQPRYR